MSKPFRCYGKFRLFFHIPEGQVDDFIVDCCRGSNVSFESNLTFLTATDVRRKLSISVTMLNELEKQDILKPCRRLPLNGKRLYLESDVNKLCQG